MKKRKKILSLILSLTLVIGLFTGCMGEDIAIQIKKDGSCSYKMKYLYSKETYDSLTSMSSSNDSIISSGDFTKTEETINGTLYYVYSRNFEFANTKQLKSFLTEDTAYVQKMQEGSKNPSCYTAEGNSMTAPFSSVTVDQTQFIGTLANNTSGSNDVGKLSSSAMNGYTSVNDYYKSLGIIIDISVALPDPITDSNGTVASGGAVSWSVDTLPDSNKLMAFTQGTPIASDTEAPVITGVKNNGIYKKATVTATDNVGIKTFSNNGYRFNVDKMTVTNNGKYTFKATDFNNNSTEVTIRIDKTKPVIKGAKANKVYRKAVKLKFKDNSKVKSVKINGKKASTKKVTLKKKGKYTVVVKDLAGNTTKLKFRIK